ncbi:MAG: GNAT family N-acetyltransferase [Spirochaeta sp.]|jgi:predicted GNAT family acetyltransferase|nr:GNAT family N-acetyltransferase [Spirochaeta sp.]
MDVQHHEDEFRFVLDVNGSEAELLYRELDERTLEYSHTFVPPALRGNGAGGKVVRAAMEYARENGYRVRPSCSFVAAFVDRHPEYQEIVTR